MGVEIRPFKNFEGKIYEQVVYVDGEVLPKQTVEGPWIEGDTVKVSCITDASLHGPMANPDTIPYQVKPCEVTFGTSKHAPGMEITTFWLKLD